MPSVRLIPGAFPFLLSHVYGSRALGKLVNSGSSSISRVVLSFAGPCSSFFSCYNAPPNPALTSPSVESHPSLKTLVFWGAGADIETSPSIVPVGLKVLVILLPQSPKSWAYSMGQHTGLSKSLYSVSYSPLLGFVSFATGTFPLQLSEALVFVFVF